MDKENRVCKKSKIPLPVAPLPALPNGPVKKNEEIERVPLKTINRQLFMRNISDGESIDQSKRCQLKIDSRHVTIRPREEDLDWDFKVFKEDADKSFISISDHTVTDNDVSKHERRYFNKRQVKNCLGEVISAVTPQFKSPTLESSRIKNIKRSLKRPHSRELQGLSPVDIEDKGEEKCKRRLNFNDKGQAPDKSTELNVISLTRIYTQDIMCHLLERENNGGIAKTPMLARACILNWLMKVNGPRGNPAIVQTARWYLDCMSADAQIDIEQLQLLAAACLWIAQKTYGPVMSSKKLVRCSSKAFTAGQLNHIEKSILSFLKFPPMPVVPQDFITYLSWYCDNYHSTGNYRCGEIEVAATFLCMSAMMTDKGLSGEYPSVMAAAAVRNALILLRKRSLLQILYMNPIFIDAVKKSGNFSSICGGQRKAVCLMSSLEYEYKAPLEYYGEPPYYVAQRVISAATDYNSGQHHILSLT